MLRGKRAKLASILAPEIAKQRARICARARRAIGSRDEYRANRALRTVERQCDGVLLPDFVLEFDDPDLPG